MDQVTLANAQRLLQLLDCLRAGQQRSPLFQQLSAWGLSLSHLRVLNLLAPDRVVSMRELAAELGITPPSLTALIRRLVHNGLVERRPCPDDSRVTLLALTAAGQALHRDLESERLARMAHLLSGLSHAEQALFLDLIDRAIRH